MPHPLSSMVRVLFSELSVMRTILSPVFSFVASMALSTSSASAVTSVIARGRIFVANSVEGMMVTVLVSSPRARFESESSSLSSSYNR